MAIQTLNTIKNWFKTGLKPTQEQFWDTWDSFRHKSQKVPVKDVEGIEELLNSKTDQFDFKTINGESIIGNGDLVIEGDSSQNLQAVLNVGRTASIGGTRVSFGEVENTISTGFDQNAISRLYINRNFNSAALESIDFSSGSSSVFYTNMNSTPVMNFTNSSGKFTKLLMKEPIANATYTLPAKEAGNYTLATLDDITGEGSTTLWGPGTGFESLVALNSSNNQAIGDFSVAEGHSTKAIGQSSHAEGQVTEATEFASHAEGFRTIASGNGSHAEGNTTIASGQGSHAEGFNTTASGSFSHAEGKYTVGSHETSHAEGDGTIASGYASHTEGVKTKANGLASHAGGLQSAANGEGSFVHGRNSTATGDYSIVLGRDIIGTEADRTYVDKLNIKTIPYGTLDKNLGVDSDGNVIIGGSPNLDIDKVVAQGNIVYENLIDLRSQSDSRNVQIGYYAVLINNTTNNEHINIYSNGITAFKPSVNPTLSRQVSIIPEGIIMIKSDTGSTSLRSINDDDGNPNNLYFPKSNGVLTTSVNGNIADSNGNIVTVYEYLTPRENITSAKLTMAFPNANSGDRIHWSNGIERLIFEKTFNASWLKIQSELHP